MSVTIEVEIAFARFVPVPRDGEINGVNAEIAVAIQQVSPEIRWNAIVEECGGMNEERHAIHAQLRVTTPLQHLHRAGGRLRAGAEHGFARLVLSWEEGGLLGQQRIGGDKCVNRPTTR